MKLHSESSIKSLVTTGLLAIALGTPAAMAASYNPCSPKPQSTKAANPCAAKNPCAAANPCAAKENPCAAKKAKKKGTAAAKKAANPCAPGNPCAAK